MGFEPTTCCLRNSCSTAELSRHKTGIKLLDGPDANLILYFKNGRDISSRLIQNCHGWLGQLLLKLPLAPAVLTAGLGRSWLSGISGILAFSKLKMIKRR
jgi:hypothetical protein